MPRSNSVSSGSQFGAGGLRPIQAESVVTLQDAITSSIRDAILSGTLAPGERLRQDQLSARFEVSRQPIREALTRLQAEGLHHTGDGLAQQEADGRSLVDLPGESQ